MKYISIVLSLCVLMTSQVWSAQPGPTADDEFESMIKQQANQRATLNAEHQEIVKRAAVENKKNTIKEEDRAFAEIELQHGWMLYKDMFRGKKADIHYGTNDQFSENIRRGRVRLTFEPKEEDKQVWVDFSTKKEPFFIVKKLEVNSESPEDDPFYMTAFKGYVVFMVSDYSMRGSAVSAVKAYPLVAVNYMNETYLDKPLYWKTLIELFTSFPQHFQKNERGYLDIRPPLTAWDDTDVRMAIDHKSPYARFISGGLGMLASSLSKREDIDVIDRFVSVIKLFAPYEVVFPCKKTSMDFWGYYPYTREKKKPFHENSSDFRLMSMLFHQLRESSSGRVVEILTAVSAPFAEAYLKWCDEEKVSPASGLSSEELQAIEGILKQKLLMEQSRR